MNTTIVSKQLKQVMNLATDDLSEFERHYANIFYAAYVEAGLSPIDSKCACLIDVARNRALEARQVSCSAHAKQAVARSRKWQAALAVAWSDCSPRHNRAARWTEQQRFKEPEKFAAALEDMGEQEKAEVATAIDAVLLSDFGLCGCVPVKAEKTSSSAWADDFARADKQRVGNKKTTKSEAVAIPKRIVKKSAKKKKKVLTEQSADLFA